MELQINIRFGNAEMLTLSDASDAVADAARALTRHNDDIDEFSEFDLPLLDINGNEVGRATLVPSERDIEERARVTRLRATLAAERASMRPRYEDQF